MSRLRRFWQSMRFTVAHGEAKRIYAQKHHLFDSYGKNVVFQPHLLPLYSRLIRIGNNVIVGRNVEFVTHDIIHKVINASPLCESGSKERVGCVEIGDNSFIGNGAIVMYGVRIAENCVVAAGAVVVKDTEPNSVYAGVPASQVGTFETMAAKRLAGERDGLIPIVSQNQALTEEEASQAWALFDAVHGRANKVCL